MKKRLLIVLATGVWAFAGAQSTQEPARKSTDTKASAPVNFSKLVNHKKVNDSKDAVPTKSFSNEVRDQKSGAKRPMSGGLTYVGGSYNVNSIRTCPNTQVTYNAALGAIFYTHRADFTKFSAVGSGAYELSYSLNMGATWDSSFLVYANVPDRYPNGLVYNPAGNTNVKHAYWAYTGPWLSQAASQDMYENADSIAFGSSRLDSTNMVQGYRTNTKPGNHIDNATVFMSIGDDSIIHAIGNGVTLNSAGTTYDMWHGACLTYGMFNGTQYVWHDTVFRPHFMPNDNNASETPIDTIAQQLYEPGTAWSQDGKTGYVVIFGNLDSIDAVSGKNLNFVSYQPIVYVTQDAGHSWVMQKPHDFTNDPVLTKTNPNFFHCADSVNLYKPVWRLFSASQDDEHDYDLVVDKNNNLHIFGAIQASAIGSPDSSAFLSYYTHYSYVCDVTTTPAGVWTSRYIDTVDAPANTAAVSGQWYASAGTSTVAFGARIQASRTLDGSKVFCTWLNDVVTGEDSIEQPDIFGQGLDVTTGNATVVKQFTNNAENFYLDMTDYPIVTGTSPATYTLPCVMVVPPSTQNDGNNPVEYYYSDSVMYTDNDFLPAGLPTIIANQFTVSPNYPNPYNGLTNFNLSLVKEGSVSVEVYNMVGQKMWTREPQKMEPGMHVITLNSAGYSAGVYFYRVTVNGQSITQKMIVE